MEYRTKNINVAAVLSALNHRILRIDKSQSNRADFVFESNDQLQLDVNKFFNKELKFEPNNLFNQLKHIKSRLYDE